MDIKKEMLDDENIDVFINDKYVEDEDVVQIFPDEVDEEIVGVFNKVSDEEVARRKEEYEVWSIQNEIKQEVIRKEWAEYKAKQKLEEESKVLTYEQINVIDTSRFEKMEESLRSSYLIVDRGLQQNKQFVKMVVVDNPTYITYAHLKIRDDSEFMKDLTLNSKIDFLKFASDRLKDDKNFIQDIVSAKGFALQYAGSSVRNDPDTILKAYKSFNGTHPQFEKVIYDMAGDDIKTKLGEDNFISKLESIVLSEKLDNTLPQKEPYKFDYSQHNQNTGQSQTLKHRMKI